MGRARHPSPPTPAPSHPKAAGRGLAPWQVRTATQLLLSDASADHSVTRLADACGLSRSYFGKAFKISTGVSPHRWLLLHRVQRAADMLVDAPASISEIALQCGFSDQSHLTRVFRATSGLSPGDWRRRRKSG